MILPVQTESEILREKALIFAEELKNWDPETITMAFREHARNSRFMPSLNELVGCCQTCSQSLEYKRQKESLLPMPDRLPDHVAEYNLQQIAKLKKKLGFKTKRR